MNSSRVMRPFSIKSFASASVCARLETRSSSIRDRSFVWFCVWFLLYYYCIRHRLTYLVELSGRSGWRSLQLITSSNLVAFWTGNFCGCCPFEILSTYQAPLWPNRQQSGLMKDSSSSATALEEHPYEGIFFFLRFRRSFYCSRRPPQKDRYYPEQSGNRYDFLLAERRDWTGFSISVIANCAATFRTRESYKG